jgi:hypothetical protein
MWWTPPDFDPNQIEDLGALSPGQLEAHYRHLCQNLERRATAAWHLAQIAQFLWRCPRDYPGVEAYLLDLEPTLADTAARYAPVGWRPVPLAALADTLRHFRTRSPDLGNDWRAAEMQIRQGAARLFAYAGALGPAIETWTHAEVRPAAALSDLEGASPRARLREAVDRSRASTAERLEAIDAAWSDPFGPGAAPVVEHPGTRGPFQHRPRIGGVLDVRVDLLDRRDADHLTVEGYRSGLLTLQQSQLDAPVAAARRLLAETAPADAEARWAGRISLLGSESQAAGASIHLAVAAHFYAEVLRAMGERVRSAPREGVLLTGRVRPDGAVPPVAEDSLPLKVQTAFFSPAQVLVVPSAQEQTAAAHCDRLLDDYPQGALRVLGIESFPDVYYDRRVTRRVHIGRVQHAIQRARHHRSSLTSGAVIAVLLAVIGWMWLGPIDQNPVSATLEGTHMVLVNANGTEVERIEVGEEAVRRIQLPSPSYQDLYALADVTGDGQNDVCWVDYPGISNPRAPYARIQCKHVGASEPLWSRPVTFDVSFPRKPEIVGRQYDARDLLVGDFDASGTPEVILAAVHRPYFPGVLWKLDAQTGEELARYVHPGHLKDVDAQDLNDDGILELLACSASNAYDQTAFFALDPRFMHGHAPTRGDYGVEGLPKATEVAYLRIPPTIVHRTQTEKRNSCRYLEAFPQEDRLNLRIYDGQPQEGQAHPFIVLHLNQAFEPQGIGTSDAYDRLVRRLLEADRIDRAPDHDYFQQYLRELRYWNGDGWQAEPVMRWHPPS